MVSITSSIRVLASATGATVVRARSVNAGGDHLMRAPHCHEPPERMWAAAKVSRRGWAVFPWRRRES
jgi:hypothetical protein